jgi:hypothetical protein
VSLQSQFDVDSPGGLSWKAGGPTLLALDESGDRDAGHVARVLVELDVLLALRDHIERRAIDVDLEGHVADVASDADDTGEARRPERKSRPDVRRPGARD